MRHPGARQTLLSLALSLALVSCGSGRNEPPFHKPDAGGGGTADGGGWWQDAGASDAGSRQDAGASDGGGMDGGVGGDAGSEGDGGGLDGGGPQVPLRAIISLTDVPQASLSKVEALVTDTFDPAPSAGCTVTNYDPNPVDTHQGFDAGPITVGGLAGSAVTLTPVAGGPYGVRYQASGSIPQPLFRDGNTLFADAAGGPDLGAFHIQMATPADVGLTTPAAGSQPVSQARSQALSIRWTAAGGDLVMITLTPAAAFFLDSTGGTMAVCITSDTGAFDVPAQTLSGLRTDDPLTENYFLGVTRVVQSTKLLGGGSEVVLWAGRAQGAAIQMR